MIKGIDYGQYVVIIDGRQVDVAHGDLWAAMRLEQEWQEALADDNVVGDNLDKSFDELLLDDGYWKNGDCQPLRLEPETDDNIPFDGEPCDGPRVISASDEVGVTL